MTAVAKHYECTVTVLAEFIADQSDVEHNRYAFSYQVKIINTGNVAAQLISRHWIIHEDRVNKDQSFLSCTCCKKKIARIY